MNFSKFRDSRISRCIKVLDKSDRRKVVVVIFIQIAMGVLDLTGVALIGILGALAVSGVESKQPGNRVQSILKIINISHSTLQTQAAILGALAVTVLMIRTVLSVFFTKRILFFLSRRGANLSKTLITKLLARPLMEIQSRSSIETLFAVTTGVGSITIGVIGTIVTLLSDISLLLIMSVGLFVVDPLLATLTFIIFSIVGFILYRQLDKRVGNLGNLEAEKISRVIIRFWKCLVHIARPS
jgi:ATP-binding cassette subfamily C protein